MPKCIFCNKVLKTEKGFQNHMCEKKRRYVEFNEVAYRVWLMISNIFRINIPKNDEKKKMAFINDTFYNKIVDFTKWILEVNVINLFEYISFLKNHDIKIDSWKDSRVYHCWLYEFIHKEPEAIAIKRSADYLDALNLTLDNISSNRLFLSLKYGNISYKYLNHCGFNAREKLDDSQWVEVRALLMDDQFQGINLSLGN